MTPDSKARHKSQNPAHRPNSRIVHRPPRDARRPPASVSVPTDSAVSASAEITCASCRFAKPLEENATAIACHRNPPEITAVMGNQISTAWPLVGSDQWCGEFSAKSGSKI